MTARKPTVEKSAVGGEVASKIGRPSSFTQQTADAICARLIEGQSLRSICSDEAMPDKSTVMRWLASNEAFRDQYACAREAQADAMAEEILEIADDASRDTETRTNADGETYEVADHEWIARSRLRVDARKWLASKMAPKKYGDKVTQELTGEGGGAIKTVSRVEYVVVDPNA